MIIEFISYDGDFPYLCSGVLKLKIEGKILKFGYWGKCDYPPFWSSGGWIEDDEDVGDYVSYQDDWIINAEKLPDFLRRYADEISKIFNDNVPQGCCGGCI